MDDSTLQAGTGIRNISPRTPLFLVGYPHVNRIATGIHDPLLATALCLRNDRTAVLLVAIDILFLDPPTARELRSTIQRETGVPADQVFVSCSHTHSGPVTLDMLSWESDPVVPHPDPAYMRYFKEQVVAAAGEAAAHTRPAALAWTAGHAVGVGGNRLSRDGIADPEVPLLLVRDQATRRLVAVDMTYCMHPTVLHEDSTLVTADFPAFTRQYLQSELGDKVAILYHSGPCGNQSPRYSVTGQTFAEAERLGRTLGRCLLPAIQEVPDQAYAMTVQLGGVIMPAHFPARRLPSVAEAEANLTRAVAEFKRLQQAQAGHGPVRTAECAVFGAEETVTLARAQQDNRLQRLVAHYLPAEIQVLRIGERYVAGYPAEIFVEYGLDLKRRSDQRAFAVSLVNGEMQGYIVTPEAMAAGGYEAGNSLFHPEAGLRMVEAALAGMESLAQPDRTPTESSPSPGATK